MKHKITKRIRVYGIVQGVGFRPTVSRHAMEAGIGGTVSNKGPYVEIFAQGTEDQVAAFLTALEQRPPRRAAILKLDVREAPDAPEFSRFDIIESEKTRGEIFVSPDIAICEDCKRELYDPGDRRYLHPFINCTCCGPRLTILDALPYDRERTSMKEFPMCPECAWEYETPETRRYDAQPVCCNHCGPEVYLLDEDIRGREAITAVRKTILDGGIVAVKGIGGFHLCCDATNEAAVELLRKRKHRPMKPFAVMARNEQAAAAACEISGVQMEVLTGHQKPILLLRKKQGSAIAQSVAPDNPKLGVMLPYAPVQLLLFDYDDGLVMPDYLVMTSANDSGAPICRDDRDASRELKALCDRVLSHNRLIRIRADDTVMDFYEDRPYMIRRSRGYAPLPVILSTGYRGQVLAIGGELKNTFCIGAGELFYPSPYVGDLGDVRTVHALSETVERFKTLLEVEPQVVVSDLHPRYNSTALAESMGLPVLQVQHHYAHILSCMAENDFHEPVIGISFDGTGYGTDGTIWGGELMLASGEGFARLGSIAPFPQTGGDLSAREGWRIGLALISSVVGDQEQAAEMAEALGLCGKKEALTLIKLSQRGINTVTSTSAGRLFDGISAILGIRRTSSFEGEGATALQFAAEAYAPDGSEIPVSGVRQVGEMLILPTDVLSKEILTGILAGEEPEKLAYLFHLSLASQIVEAAELARQRTGCTVAALSGGCFQNLLLLELTVKGLLDKGFRVLTHSMIPPNDGGVALGQAYYGMNQINNQKNAETQTI